MTARFDALPKPKPGRLTLYLFGPRFGESAVLAMPDGKWVVVDCCRLGRLNLPLGLLEHFGASQIDLLVVTHPDLDHIAGVDELIARFKIRRAWCFPAAGTLYDLMPRLISLNPKDRRLAAVARAMTAIEGLRDANIASESTIQTRSWSSGSKYQVHCIAPVQHDIEAYRRPLRDALVEFKDGRYRLGTSIKQFLSGSRRSLGVGGNGLSLAVSIEWGPVRMLLGGDVEVGAGARSGWAGIIEVLTEDGQINLIKGATVVKVAHHGSLGAFHAPAWALHATGADVQVAAIAPFDRGRNPPPHEEVMKGLSTWARSLAITAEPRGGWSTVPSGSWLRDSRKVSAIGDLPVLAIELKQDAGGRHVRRVIRGTPGRVFTRR